MKAYLISESVKVTDVKQITHSYSNYASFIVSVEKNEDYLKLISGSHIPEGVSVRRYFPPRGDRANQPPTGFSRQLAALQDLENIFVSGSSDGSGHSGEVLMQVSSDSSLEHPVDKTAGNTAESRPPSVLLLSDLPANVSCNPTE